MAKLEGGLYHFVHPVFTCKAETIRINACNLWLAR